MDESTSTWSAASKWWAILLCLAMMAPAFAIMGPEPFWDDIVFISKWNSHASWASLLGPFEFGRWYWRPLGSLAIYAPLALGESSMWWIKSISICIWMAAACLGFSYAMRGRASKSGLAALFALAACFALSPVFAEAAMWMSARFDAMLMLVLALALWSMDSKPKAPWWMAGLLGLAICLCKETGWIWIGLLAIGMSFDKERRGWRDGFIVAFALAMAIRIAMLHGLDAPRIQAAHGDLLAMAAWSMESMGRSALALLVPFFESSPMRSAGLSDAWVKWMGFLFFLIGPVLAMLGLKSWRSGRWGVAAPWALAAWGALAFQAIAVATGLPHAREHSLAPLRYVAPSALIFMALAARWALDASFVKSRLAMLCHAWLWVHVAMSVHVGMQAKIDWSGPEEFWRASATHEPIDSISVTNYAVVLSAMGKQDQAVELSIKWVDRMKDGERLCVIWRLAESGQAGAARLEKIRQARLAVQPCASARSIESR